MFANTGAQEHAYPASLTYGWGGDLPVEVRETVSSKRPFDIGIRPDGKRAIVPLFQTGNFGILDLEAQSVFPNPDLAALPADLFKGFVATTPSIPFDNHLWPNRGKVRLFRDGSDLMFDLPSPDEALLYPRGIQYAQNGRFAVAVHGGTGRLPGTLQAPTTVSSCSEAPRDPCGTIPLFIDFPDFVSSMLDLGLTPFIDVFPGSTLAVPSGGGAISIVNDKAISQAFGTAPSFADGNLAKTVIDDAGKPRPFYRFFPVCKELVTDVLGNPQRRCETPAVTSILGPPNGRYVSPRGVDIQPIVSLVAPRAGEIVWPTAAVHAVWHTANVASVRFEMEDLLSSGNTSTFTATPAEGRQDVKIRMADLLRGAQNDTSIRLTAVALDANGDEVSRTSVEVLLRNGG